MRNANANESKDDNNAKLPMTVTFAGPVPIQFCIPLRGLLCAVAPLPFSPRI